MRGSKKLAKQRKGKKHPRKDKINLKNGHIQSVKNRSPKNVPTTHSPSPLTTEGGGEKKNRG